MGLKGKLKPDKKIALLSLNNVLLYSIFTCFWMYFLYNLLQAITVLIISFKQFFFPDDLLLLGYYKMSTGK